MPELRCWCSFVAAACLLAPTSLGQVEPQAPGADGRDLRHYARDRFADVRHVQLEVLLAAPAEFRLEIIERLSFEPLDAPLAAWTLDAVDLDVRAVTLAGAPVDFVSDGSSLTLRFDRPLQPGRERELMIRYFVDRPQRGLAWRPPAPQFDRAGEIHTDADLRGARHWFVGFDDPGERFTFGVQADVPAAYDVISNGRRVDSQTRAERRLVRWRLGDEITTDQAILCIGAYESVASDWQALPLSIHSEPGVREPVEPFFESLRDMLAYFEQVTGVSYPWDGLTLVAADLASGGCRSGAGVIEVHAPLLTEWLESAEDFDAQLLAEAVAAQWAGALLTPTDWSEVWTTRGLARYLSCLWLEHARGEGAFAATMVGMADQLITGLDSQDRRGLVHRQWTDPNLLLTQSDDPTLKGAWVYHMLRRRLGDTVFRAAVHDLFGDAAENGIETDDVSDAMQRHTGLSVDRIIAYYVTQTGLPHLQIKVGWSDDASMLTLVVTQVPPTATAAAMQPAYELQLPLLIQLADATELRLVTVAERSEILRLPLPALPRFVAIDPHMSLLVKREDSRPALLWLAQLTEGPTAYSRHLAARGLGERPDHRTQELLAGVAADPGQATLVRRSAAQALGDARARQAQQMLIDLAQRGFDAAELRLELVRQISMTREDEVDELLSLHAAADPDPRVAAAAVRYLGLRRVSGAVDLVRQILADPSVAPQVRRASLETLLALDDGGAFDLALGLTSPGATTLRTRAAAIEVAAGLGYRAPDETLTMLRERLAEPAALIQQAALAGLLQLGDERGVPELEFFAASAREPQLRELAASLLEQLRARIEASQTEEGRRLDFLQQRVRELESEVNRLRDELTEARREAG